jgi:hypothetical protein
MNLTLAACLPFSLSAVAKSHGWVRLAPFGTDTHTGGLTYVEQLDSGRVVGLLIQEATGGVSVEVNGQLSRAECEQVARKVEWMLGFRYRTLFSFCHEFHAQARKESAD